MANFLKQALEVCAAHCEVQMTITPLKLTGNSGCIILLTWWKDITDTVAIHMAKNIVPIYIQEA